MENSLQYDKLEHTGVYIVDKDTLITYYENPVAQKYSIQNRIGQPCYSIHGNTSMCSSCPLRKKEGVSFVNRIDLKMVFKLTSEEVQWEGHAAYKITVVKERDLANITEQEVSLSRMNRALEKSVNVYTEINMETMQYRQMNIQNCNHFSVQPQGDYASAFEYMCAHEIAPEDVAEVRRTMAPEVLRAMSANSDGPEESVVRYHLKNDATGTMMQSRAIFMRDELPHYVVSIATDVTAEQLREEQLQALSKTIENVDVGIYAFEVCQGRFKIIAANPAVLEMLGRNASSIAVFGNDNVYTVCHPEDKPIIRQAIEVLTKPNQKYNFEYRAKHGETGEYIWVAARGRSIQQQDGSLMVYICYIDINHRKKLQGIEVALEAEKKANQAKSNFMSTISHDMRTPLNGILGLTTLLKGKIKDTEAMKDLVDLEISGRYLLNLINDTLDVSKIESGKLELHPAVCVGKTLFNNVLKLVAPSIAAKNINFTVNADNLPFTKLYVDSGRIEQTVMNVLSNAIKFTPEGGSISVQMRNLSVKNNIILDEIVIKDSGIGMKPEFLKNIFEPFSQADNTITSSTEGTGLGMTITKRLLDLMGGTINIASQLGAGTTVTITLPMTIATEEQIKASSQFYKVGYGQVNLKGKRVLMCEDHPLNAKIAMKLLTTKGVIVEQAQNGAVGVQMFAQSALHYYDGILMDIRMPIMDGIQATQQIRSLDRADAKAIPIIAMTANAFAEDIEKTEQAGMNAHISKPIEVNVLYQTLGKFLGQNTNAKSYKVLIVDDENINRAVINEALKDSFEVFEASNGKEALEILNKEHDIDVLITDIQMPVMNGEELIKKVRSNKQWQHVVVIANTQFGDSTLEERLLAMGANDFVYKAATPKILTMRVRNAMRTI